MNIEEQLKLAAQIYALKVVLQPSWDLQKHARESFSTAMQFFLAVQAEQAGSSSSHWSILDSIVAPDTSSSSPHPPPDSTTSTPKQSAPDSTAAAESGSETAPPEHTGSSQKQSQDQSTLGIQQVPYAPYYPDLGHHE